MIKYSFVRFEHGFSREMWKIENSFYELFAIKILNLTKFPQKYFPENYTQPKFIKFGNHFHPQNSSNNRITKLINAIEFTIIVQNVSQIEELIQK